MVSQLPACFRNIIILPIPTAEVEAAVAVHNSYLGYRSPPTSPEKPISKIFPIRSDYIERRSRAVELSPIAGRPDIEHDGKVVLYTDCIPVRGMAQSAIYDLTRQEIILFPTPYIDLLDHLRVSSIRQIVDLASEVQAERVISFVHFLLDRELAQLIHGTGETQAFPKVSCQWETNGVIQNAIIDIDARQHDLQSIVSQLVGLGCRFVQIRCFSAAINLEAVEFVLTLAANTSIECLEILTKYQSEVADDNWLRIARNHPLLSRLAFHSSPEDRLLELTYEGTDGLGNQAIKTIEFYKREIDSEHHCGAISQALLNPPNARTVAEFKNYNGCLNRKVSVDKSGIIRNCPSSLEGFGNIDSTSLREVVFLDSFRRAWNIGKDRVEVCRHCEFRYVCSDCRAYTQGGYLLGKPAKCSYDPQTANWS